MEGTSDIPKLASSAPSALYYSVSGIDVGYTYVNLRGFDQSRMSVMVNGIPQNGPEDHQVYWIDMPELLSSTKTISIQRGSGTAYFGPPAIGGSINAETQLPSNRLIEVTGGIGSYGTRKYSVSANSGLLDEKYLLYGRFSQLHSDGYRHFSWTDMMSYFLSAAAFYSDFSVRVNAYGGPIDDGLYYYGIPRDLLSDPESRRTNLSESFTYERRPEEKEHFTQPHFEVLSDWRLSPTVTLSNTLFAILGDGYFNLDGTWPGAIFSIPNAEFFRLTTPYATRYGFAALDPKDTNFKDQLYSAHVTNKQFGWMPRLEVDHDYGKLTVSAELRSHRSLHYGELLSAGSLTATLPKDYHFYEFRGGKDIVNASVLEQLTPVEGFRLSGSLQLVDITYRVFDEKPRYVDTASAALTGLPIGWMSNNFDLPLHFLNPKVGVSVDVTDRVSGYASVSSTTREPKLSDYYNGESLTAPNFVQSETGFDYTRPFIKPESVIDYEVGVDFRPFELDPTLSIGGHLGGYLMNFHDELVKTSLSDLYGNPVVLNASKTLHEGIEASLGLYSPYFQLVLNATFSRNEIVDVDTNFVDAGAIGHTPVGFAPVLASANFQFTPITELSMNLLGRYVGRLYGDLANSPEYANDPYVVMDAVVAINLDSVLELQKLSAKLQVNNLLNKQYASYVGSDGLFFPAAPRNFFVTVSLGL